jgi:polysaccharide export outer membrane protein
VLERDSLPPRGAFEDFRRGTIPLIPVQRQAVSAVGCKSQLDQAPWRCGGNLRYLWRSGYHNQKDAAWQDLPVCAPAVASGGLLPQEPRMEATMRAIVKNLVWSFMSLGALGAAHADEPLYTVKAGDVLSVAVWKEPDLTSNTVLVRPDGTFSFPLVGQVDARGKSVQELQNLVTERLKKYIADPVVTVSVQEVKGNKVYVIGQVTKAGEFVVNPSVNVMQALSMAGGATAFASLNNIIVLRRTAAGQVALPFHYNDVVRGKDLQQNMELQAGDIVVVP